MSLLLRRAPADGWLSEEWQKEMARIEDCLHCGQCEEQMSLRAGHAGTSGQESGRLQEFFAGPGGPGEQIKRAAAGRIR